MKTLVLIISAIFLLGCQPQDLAIEDRDQIIINKSNLEIYTYADLSKPNDGWVKKENGDKFRYWIDGNTLEVASERPFKFVYNMGLGSKEQLKCSDEYIFKYVLVDSITVFRIHY